jgi:hypothetical protein
MNGTPKPNPAMTTSSRKFPGASAILISFFLGVALHAAPTAKPEAATSQPAQKEFDTPQLAVDSLVQAAEAFDAAALKEILGPDSADLISSEDPVMDKNRALAFAAKAKEKNSVQADPKNANRVVLSVGNDDFPVHDPDSQE